MLNCVLHTECVCVPPTHTQSVGGQVCKIVYSPPHTHVRCVCGGGGGDSTGGNTVLHIVYTLVTAVCGGESHVQDTVC